MPASVERPRFLPVGDIGLSVEFGADIDPSIHDRVVALDQAVVDGQWPGVIETVPSYRSLLIIYEPAEVSVKTLQSQLEAVLETRQAPQTARHWTVPVAYEPPFGEDVEEVAALLRLSGEEVIRHHTSADFRVYMLGFQPAMPYLGGLPKPLHVSRRVQLRAPAPDRAVAIGGMQSAIVPFASTTGWYLLGRTPVRPFDPRRNTPALFQPGDTIRFRPISATEYYHLDEAANDGDLLAGAELAAA